MRWFILIGLWCGFLFDSAFAQCVMCKSTVLASESRWYQLAQSINNGIIYLLSVPYLLVFFFALWWYRQYRKTKEKK